MKSSRKRKLALNSMTVFITDEVLEGLKEKEAEKPEVEEINKTKQLERKKRQQREEKKERIRKEIEQRKEEKEKQKKERLRASRVSQSRTKQKRKGKKVEEMFEKLVISDSESLSDRETVCLSVGLSMVMMMGFGYAAMVATVGLT